VYNRAVVPRRALAYGIAIVAGFAGLLWLLGTGTIGRHWGPRRAPAARLPEAQIAARAAATARAARSVGAPDTRPILFGDLHVHTTFSADAFRMALPLAGGSGARPVDDACDFARYCAELDFWSINDHAESSTPRRWAETLESIRQCDAVAGDPSNPDVAVFLGWEWTQMGATPAEHHGHRSVVLRHLDDARIPDRPLAARAPPGAADNEPRRRSPFLDGWLPLLRPGEGWLDFLRYRAETADVPPCPDGVPPRELPPGCRARASTPAELFAWLDAWGSEALVIAHGTTAGLYTPAGESWDEQVAGAMHDPRRQVLVELYSGHGNTEEFRSWRDVAIAPDGTRSCPEPTRDHEPACWRAGEIVRARCLAQDESETECDERASAARQNHVDAGLSGHLTVPGARPEDWLDAGQCRSCFLPAFNHRPRGSVQYLLALRDFGAPEGPRRLHFGFIGSGASHSARPGTGYKEYARTEMTESRLPAAGLAFGGGRGRAREPEPYSRPLRREDWRNHVFALREAERSAPFFLTGGLVAAHADGRSRDAIWEALQRREVYATSGPRILLWFDLINPPGSSGSALPMGSEAHMSEPPVFQARAVGSFEQQPGCTPSTRAALGEERLQHLCRGECYHPSDVRRRITRIEVVRIRPQAFAGEPVEGLIEDPWRIFHCDDRREGCVYTFSDPDFPAGGRDVVYYVRAIEEPSAAVNADPLRCARDEQGICKHVAPCTGPDPGEDCLAQIEERAWSSPILVVHAGLPPP
jgi:hypothetical protein